VLAEGPQAGRCGLKDVVSGNLCERRLCADNDRIVAKGGKRTFAP
jgi:hypothetical protein